MLPNDNLEQAFWEAENQWDLERLYADLQDYDYTSTPIMDARLRGVVLGLTPKEIAEALGITPGTVSQSLSDELAEPIRSLLQLEGNVPWHRLHILLKRAGYCRADSNLIEPNSSSIALFPNEEKPDSFTSTFYVKRPPVEDDCGEEVLKSGALIRIRATQMMGKSLLLDKIIFQARKHDYRTVVLGFKLADSTVLTDTKAFIKWFCARVTKLLKLPNQLDAHWDDVFGCNSNATDYFEEYLLVECTQPLVVALDNVDLVFEHSVIAQDFCSLLRGWYDMARRDDDRSLIWKRLRLVVVHSTEVYRTFDINRSPLAGVGKVFPLSEFTPDQVQELAQLYGLDWLITQIEQLIAMVGGHPYLVSQAFDYIERRKITLEEFLQVKPEAGPFSDHLREQLWMLQQNPALAAACCEVVTQNKPVLLVSEHTFKLQSMGLVQLRDGNCIPRCELYRRYFSEHLAAT
jgi:transcriptional regulator with XRE-family HTH domain